MDSILTIGKFIAILFVGFLAIGLVRAAAQWLWKGK